MAAIERFEDIKVWQRARDLAKQIYEMTCRVNAPVIARSPDCIGATKQSPFSFRHCERSVAISVFPTQPRLPRHYVPRNDSGEQARNDQQGLPDNLNSPRPRLYFERTI